MNFEAVIGLEIHVEMKTKSKIEGWFAMMIFPWMSRYFILSSILTEIAPVALITFVNILKEAETNSLALIWNFSFG